MRRKRLKHAAQQLCQMFCGWRLHFDKPTLASLKSGTLVVDALTGQCAFDGVSIEPLAISTELKQWLHNDLQRHNIPIEAVSSARLTVELELAEIPWQERSTGEEYFVDGKELQTPTLHRATIRCSSEVATDDLVYQATYRDVEEWPPGWPAV